MGAREESSRVIARKEKWVSVTKEEIHMGGDIIFCADMQVDTLSTGTVLRLQYGLQKQNKPLCYHRKRKHNYYYNPTKAGRDLTATLDF